MFTQPDLARALSKVARDKMTLINQGFVHAVVLRYREGRAAAQLEYADNLAETRRLLTILLHSAQLGICLDPDGYGSSDEYARPLLGGSQQEIWNCDLDVIQRSLPALRDVVQILSEKPDCRKSFEQLRSVQTETLEYAKRLTQQLEGSFSPVTSAQGVGSEAEKITLEHFIGYSKDVEPKWQRNVIVDQNEAHDELAAALNSLLLNQFIAVEQYLLQGFVLSENGSKATAEHCFWQSVEEMRSAFRLSQVILLLGSTPGNPRDDELLLPHHVESGQGIRDMLQQDFQLAELLLRNNRKATLIAEAKAETSVFDALLHVRARQQKFTLWLGERLKQEVEGLVDTPVERKGSGSFDAMLARWNVH
jgi:bacterioferritin (cytochrome b1)